MLHNTGLYGSNETPVNMGAPLNISQLGTPMNMVQNLNNLSKMPAQPPPTASGHFNQPNYGPYGNPPVNVNPQMHPFQNYHSLGYQHGYPPQNSTVMQNSSWQNAMLPMSLNMHGDHTPNMLNYGHIDKRLSQPVSSYKDQHYVAKTPLNIPQVPNKLFPKHSEPVLNPENAFNTIYKQLNMLKEANNMELNMKTSESLMYHNTKETHLGFSMKSPESLLYNTLKETKNIDVSMKPDNMLYNKLKQTNNLDLSMKATDNLLYKAKEPEFDLRIKSPESLLPHKSKETDFDARIRSPESLLPHKSKEANFSLKSPENLTFKTKETNNLDLSLKSPENLLYKTNEAKTDCDMRLPESTHFNMSQETHLDLSMKSPENLLFNKSRETDAELSIKSPESLLYDNNRRKNLENTVRLIENILINTTKNREMKQNNEKQNKSEHNPNYNEASKKMETEVSQSKISNDFSSNKVPSNTEIDEDALDDIPEDSDYNDNEAMSVDSVSNKSSIKEVEKSEKQEEKQSDEEESQSSLIVESTIQVEIDPVIIKEEPPDDDEVGKQVVVKIEEMTSWADTDHMTPFHRDVNGVTKENALHGNIIDSETSVMDAMEVVKSGGVSGKKLESYYECPHCALLFEHPKRFLIHAKWHGFGLINVQRHQVAIVKQERRKEKEEARRISKIELTDPNGKLYPCKHCDKVYQAKGSLDGHRQRCHSNRSRDCKLCNKSISGGWSAWRMHQQSHSTEAGYQCNECPKRFKYSHSLAKHKDTHLEKTHACPEPDCPKKFGSQALLKVHLKSHERAKLGASFHCTYCGKSFYDKFNLQIHERKHTNERPFVCEICNATFGCNSNLSRHLKVSHSASKPHVCSTCNRSFATALIRDRHEMRLHGDPEEFKYICKQCPSRYMKQVDLRKHTYKMHPKPKSEKAKE